MSPRAASAPADPATHRGAFWTARQRQASSLHEISYRACFKPQLPRYFIERFSAPGDRVYDPFSGRGTTAIEAALLGRAPAANDANPLARLLAEPRLHPPDLAGVAERLETLFTGEPDAQPEPTDLSMFYHPDTEAEIRRLRAALLGRAATGAADALDGWIRMVATNRLTGHSPGFFSVYSLPPNQAVTAEQQRRINARLGQAPAYRDTRKLVLAKTRSLLRNVTGEQRAALAAAARDAVFMTGDARHTPALAADSVALTVTSPPFLDVVDYASDNWLRCWFNGLDAAAVKAGVTAPGALAAWSAAMADVLAELHRVTRRGGHVAFEVGEVRRGTIHLDEVIVPLGQAVGFAREGVWINTQRFTKTSNIWGVSNNRRGTNTNRVVVFRKP